MTARRALLSWASLAVLAVAAAGAAALGVVQGGPGLGVGQVIAATSAARSARFTERSVTTSANPDLRSESLTTGRTDFATGTGFSRTTSRSVSFSSTDGGPLTRSDEAETTAVRFVGGSAYRRLATTPVGAIWVKLPAAFDSQPGLIGSVSAIDPGALGLLVAPAADLALSPLGTVTHDGSSLRVFRVEVTRPRAACLAGVPYDKDGAPLESTEVWADPDSRLVQVQSRLTFRLGPLPARLPAALRPPMETGTALTVTTLRLADFGTAVAVEVPSLQPRQSEGGSATLSLVGSCRTVPVLDPTRGDGG